MQRLFSKMEKLPVGNYRPIAILNNYSGNYRPIAILNNYSKVSEFIIQS
jgi:hypothetical protein